MAMYSDQKVYPRRWQPGIYPPKPPCRESSIYDDAHFDKHGPDCRKKHYLYKWKGVKDERATLIADSLCKWLRAVPHLTVQSVPGLNLSSAMDKICLGELEVDRFELAILAIGSNDLEGKSIDYVVKETRELIRHVQQTYPHVKIAVSNIIPRTGMSCEKKRVDINSLIKRICKDLGIPYLAPFKSVLANKLQESGLYAHDNIHLSDDGIVKLKSFYIGAAAAHLIGTPGQRKKAE